MELHEYEPLAMRTAKMMEPLAMLTHGAMGCLTEAGEFSATAALYCDNGYWDCDNAMEELGDGLWFASYTAAALGTTLAAVGDRVLLVMPRPQQLDKPHCGDLVGTTLFYCASAEWIGTPVKAHVYYGKSLDSEVVLDGLSIFYKRIVALASICGLSMSRVMEHNIAKLRKRYPDKYTDAAAIERADKTEPSTLPENKLFDKAVQLSQPAAWPFPKSRVDDVA